MARTPRLSEPLVPVYTGLALATGLQQPGYIGWCGAVAQDPHRVGGQLAGRERGRVAVGQAGLQLGHADEGVLVIAINQADRRLSRRAHQCGVTDGH
jgi:hypothetical protein